MDYGKYSELVEIVNNLCKANGVKARIDSGSYYDEFTASLKVTLTDGERSLSSLYLYPRGGVLDKVLFKERLDFLYETLVRR